MASSLLVSPRSCFQAELHGLAIPMVNPSFCDFDVLRFSFDTDEVEALQDTGAELEARAEKEHAGKDYTANTASLGRAMWYAKHEAFREAAALIRKTGESEET